MKFRTKLYLGLGSFFLLIIILSVVLMTMFNQITVNMNVVVKELSERVRMTSSMKYEILNTDRELKDLMSSPPDELLTKFTNEMEQSRLRLNTGIEYFKKMDTGEHSQELVLKFKTLYETYDAMQHQIMTLKKADKKDEYEKLLWYDAKQLRERMLQLLDLLQTVQEQKMKDELYRSRETYNFAVKMVYSYIFIGLFIGIGLSVWLIRSMTKNLNKVTSVMTSAAFSSGTQLPRIEMNSKDEIGAIAEAFNGMAQALEQRTREEEGLKERAQEHSWLNTKIAEVATMFPEFNDLRTLGQLFLAKVAPMVGASYGVFYIKEGNGEQQTLQKHASYAFDRENAGMDHFRFGEGLVGQCAAENRTMLLTQIPDDYIKIRSGVGMSSPENIILLPAEFEGEVLAVIELASFKRFSPLQQKLLHELMSRIGVTISSIENRMQVEKLLQESQALTEELQSQSEDLQLQQEELRTTNEKLEEQYQAAELNSQYKSEFLANMSHELRTPLNSLLILAQMLAQNGEGNLSAKQEEYARTIYSSGMDLLHLINDILDLEKMESGHMEVIPEEVELEDIGNYVQNQFSPIARKKRIDFNVQLDPDLPAAIRTDQQRLQQILKNLLSNAFKFTHKGRVSLRIYNADQTEQTVAFSVADSGIGIPREKHELIFEAFKQADGTTSRKYGGTGLGLSISRENARLLGGFIEVSSVLGEGSTFTLYLPVTESISMEEVRSSREEAAVGLGQDKGHSIASYGQTSKLVSSDFGKSLLIGKKILIVEDDIRNVFAITTALEGEQMEVLFAENGRDGIQMLQDHPDTDLILMDIMMPEMDGYEAMRRIRQIPLFQKLPIIAITAKAMKQDREECINAGASDYISKPIDTSQLLSLMQVWLYK